MVAPLLYAARVVARGTAQRRGGRPSTGRGQPVILVADDTRDGREVYSQYFSRRGFTVITADDGAVAIRVALDHVPDVIVMDLAMPQFDGITAIRRIKADARTWRTRVILLTGYPHEDIERVALEAGANKFLMKPCLPEELERHVKGLRRPRRSA